MLNKHRVLSFLLLTLLAGLVSCSGAQTKETATQTSGNFSVSLVVNPDPPVPMTDELLEMKIVDKNGQPVRGARLSLDLSMPGMKMPENRPTIIETSPGVYQSRTMLTMAGKWKIQVVVAFEGESETYNFVINTK